MGLFDFFKKKEYKIKNIEFIDESHLITIPKSNLKYNDIEIAIRFNAKESLNHVKEDYEILMKEGIEKFIRDNFIPWLKGDDFKDLSDDKIYEGLKITEVSYSYIHKVAENSPTNQDDYFGEFVFTFNSSNDYTKNLIQGSEFELLINNGNVYYGNNYDI